MNYKIKGIFLTTVGSACWGFSGSVGQYLFQVQNMDSRWLVPIRLGLAGIILLIYCFFKNGKETLKPWSTKVLAITTLIYGILGISACQFFYFLTIQLSNAALGTILQDLAPLFILIYTCIVKHHKPRKIEIISIILAICGMFLLTSHGDVSTLYASLPALIAGVISGLCVMIYNILAPRLEGIPVTIIQGWSFLLGSIVIGLIFRSWSIYYVPNIYGVLGIIFVAFVGNIIAFTMYISGVQIIGPQKASLYSFAEPITAAIISSTVLGSVFNIYDIIGFLMIFAMMYLITFTGKESQCKIKNKSYPLDC